jgi:hypothetical protein
LIIGIIVGLFVIEPEPDSIPDPDPEPEPESTLEPILKIAVHNVSTSLVSVIFILI